MMDNDDATEQNIRAKESNSENEEDNTGDGMPSIKIDNAQSSNDDSAEGMMNFCAHCQSQIII